MELVDVEPLSITDPTRYTVYYTVRLRGWGRGKRSVKSLLEHALACCKAKAIWTEDVHMQIYSLKATAVGGLRATRQIYIQDI